MNSPESSPSSKLNPKQQEEAGDLLFEAFKESDAFTDYTLEWINSLDREKILRDFYQRIIRFFESINGLRIVMNSEWKVNSVWTFIPQNISDETISDAEKKSSLNTSGILKLMFNSSLLRNPYQKLRGIRRFGHLVSFTDNMHTRDMWKAPHIYAQYLWANRKDGSGIRLLLRGLKDLKDQNIPIYFWTVSKENEKMYTKLGFTPIWEESDPISGLSFWRFLYDPSKINTERSQDTTKNAVWKILQSS